MRRNDDGRVEPTSTPVSATTTRQTRRSSQRAKVQDVAEDLGTLGSAAPEATQNDAETADNAEEEQPALQRQTDGLRRKCPLCFGGERPRLQHTE